MLNPNKLTKTKPKLTLSFILFILWWHRTLTAPIWCDFGSFCVHNSVAQ